MARRSALKLNFRNGTDQKIIETYCMSAIVRNLVKLQRAEYQFKHGKYIEDDSPHDTFLVTMTPEIKQALEKDIEISTNRTYKLLKDVKGNGNPAYLTPLQAYLRNYTVPQDPKKQRTFSSLKKIQKKDQNFLSNYAYATSEEIESMHLTEEQKKLYYKFSSIPKQAQETLLDFYQLSKTTQDMLFVAESYNRKQILKFTQKNLSYTEKEPGEYPLTNTDIASIERKATKHDINISALNQKTNARYTSEKNLVQKYLTRRIAILLFTLGLGVSTFNMGSKIISDIGTTIETNVQSFETLSEQGFSYADFDISADTLEKLLTIQNSLSQYTVKEPTYDQQLELMDTMSETYKTIIDEKVTSAFSEKYPNSEISGLTFTDSNIMITYIEDGKMETKNFDVKDLLFQEANLSDIMKSFTVLQQLKSDVEKDKQTQADIDTAIENGLSTSTSTEYELTESIESRVAKLVDLHGTVSDATALNLSIRNNIFFDDQFISTAQGKTPIYVAPEPITQDVTMDVNSGPVSENNGIEFFNQDYFKSTDVLTHLKQFFVREHNVMKPTESVSSHDISITQPDQNYAFFVKVGDKSYIMTHGSDPQSVRNFLDSEVEKGTLAYTTTGALSVTQVVKNVSTVYDDNGNPQSSVMVDGAASYKGEVYPVISGNFHNKVLDPNYESLLADENIYKATEAMFDVKTPYSTNDYYINNAKTAYADALNAYCNAKGYTLENMPSNLVNKDMDDAR